MMIIRNLLFLLFSLNRVIVLTERACTCGLSKVSNSEVVTLKVIGGVEADLHEFPWAALLEITQKQGPKSRCGGSLISSRY